MDSEKKKILVLYNHLEETDEYLALRNVDPASLDFTPEYSIAVATAEEEYAAIVEALAREGFEARAVNLKDDFDLLCRLAAEHPPDAIFNLVEFFHNDLNHEGAVAGLFDLFGIPYTGAPPLCLSLCRRKGLTKQLLVQNGISTPRFYILKRPIIRPDHGLDYPLIIKPSRQDGSAGVDKHSVVRDYAELLHRVDRMFAAFHPPILVEEFIEGDELHVSVIGNDPPEVLPIIDFNFEELPEDHPHLITYDIKWNPLSRLPQGAFHLPGGPVAGNGRAGEAGGGARLPGDRLQGLRPGGHEAGGGRDALRSRSEPEPRSHRRGVLHGIRGSGGIRFFRNAGQDRGFRARA